MSGRRLAHESVPGLAGLLAGQAGLARRSQLRALGVTRKHVEAQIAAGRWVLVAPEVVSVDNGRLDQEQLTWRAVLHSPHGWLDGRSALNHVGLTGYPPPTIHILCGRTARPSPLDGATYHVSDRLPGPRDLHAGLPVVGAARAVVDAAAWERWPRAASGLTIAAVQQRVVTVTEVSAELALAGRVRHRAVMRDALVDASGGAESVAEVDIAPLLRRAGIAAWRRQVRSGGRRHDLEVDLPDGSILVVEVDGPSHDTPEARWADAARDAAIAAQGKLVLRISAYDVRHEPARVVAALRMIVESSQRRAEMCVVRNV
jgi:very-short-patch-repair endonuclease